MEGLGPADLVRVSRLAGVRERRVLEVVEAVPRAVFVPPDQAHLAYLDRALPIPHGQVTTQPSLVARMVEALELEGPEKVLEVGTGYGWQTGLLARLAAEVWSVERWDDLAEAARAALRAIGVDNAHVVVGDGSRGLPAQAPFDAVIVSAAYPEVPGPLVEQLAERGRLVQPVGPGGAEEVVQFVKEAGRLVACRTVAHAHFVPLIC